MKTIEELKEMSQEELVRLVQKLQEENDKMEQDNKMWTHISFEQRDKADKLTNVVKQLSSLLP